MNFAKRIATPVISAAVGAAVVGACWYGTHENATKNDVIATVGGTPITRATLDKGSESLAGQQILSQLITTQVVNDAAGKAHVSASTKDVNQALSNIESQNGITNDAELEEALASSNMTKDQLMSQLQVQVLEEKLAESKVNVTEAQIEAYYNKNKSSLATPEKRNVSVITVKTETTANQVEGDLKAGQSFSDLALKYSTDTATKAKGGALGTVTKSQLASAIQKTAFSLKSGQVSSPVKVSSGYEIVTVTGIVPSKVPALSAAKGTITNILKQQNAEAPTQLIADLTKQDNVQIKDSTYASVKNSLENPAPKTSATGQ